MTNYEVDSAYPPGGKWVRRRSELVNVCLASWNIGSLTGKSIELIKALHRRKISIACIQETKWVGAKAKEIDGFKLWVFRCQENHKWGWHFGQEGFGGASCGGEA